MAYLEGPNVKIYIHDASKDMFYELEDVRYYDIKTSYFLQYLYIKKIMYFSINRTHLREIRDRSVLRLFESNEVSAPQALPGGAGVPQPLPSNGGHWDQDQVDKKTFNKFTVLTFGNKIRLQSYFSEPEFDSDYQHQHVHKSKVSTVDTIIVHGFD